MIYMLLPYGSKATEVVQMLDSCYHLNSYDIQELAEEYQLNVVSDEYSGLRKDTLENFEKLRGQNAKITKVTQLSVSDFVQKYDDFEASFPLNDLNSQENKVYKERCHRKIQQQWYSGDIALRISMPYKGTHYAYITADKLNKMIPSFQRTVYFAIEFYEDALKDLQETEDISVFPEGSIFTSWAFQTQFLKHNISFDFIANFKKTDPILYAKFIMEELRIFNQVSQIYLNYSCLFSEILENHMFINFDKSKYFAESLATTGYSDTIADEFRKITESYELA